MLFLTANDYSFSHAISNCSKFYNDVSRIEKGTKHLSGSGSTERISVSPHTLVSIFGSCTWIVNRGQADSNFTSLTVKILTPFTHTQCQSDEVCNSNI